MSTLFENYYDSLGHEMHIGETVMGCTTGGRIYGHIIDMCMDAKGNEKYTIVPDIGCTNNLLPKLKKQYKITWRNVYLITVKKKVNIWENIAILLKDLENDTEKAIIWNA